MVVSQKEESSEHVSLASLFHEEEEKPAKVLPVYEPLENRFNKYPAPDLAGKGKLPKKHTFFPESHKEWIIDNLSIGQIRQLIDVMCYEYKLMCLRGKSEIEACKIIIQCFTGTLLRWWETESSSALIAKMEEECLKDTDGNISHIVDGQFKVI